MRKTLAWLTATSLINAKTITPRVGCYTLNHPHPHVDMPHADSWATSKGRLDSKLSDAPHMVGSMETALETAWTQS